MQSRLDALDTIAALFMLAALGMVAYSDRELGAAWLMLGIAVGSICLRWIMWSFITQHAWWVRAIVGASVGGFILGALPAFFEWTKQR